MTEPRPTTNTGSTRGRLDAIDHAIAAAERRLVEAAGDQSLCAIGRSGRPVPAVKYYEGESEALRSVRSGLVDGLSLADAIAAARRRFARYQRLAEQSADWNAYHEGGLAALEDTEGLSQG